MRTPLEVTEALLSKWQADPAGCMAAYVAPDIVYTLNVSPDALLLGGETRGRDSVTAKMLGIREQFDYLVFKPRIFSVSGDVVRTRIEFVYRHKPSGELLSGQMRSVFTVRDGLVVRVDEFVDAALIETFMRLFGQN